VRCGKWVFEVRSLDYLISKIQVISHLYLISHFQHQNIKKVISDLINMSTLYIVSTPIGNIEDVTIRAIKILMSVPVIACEDTRVTGQLRKLIREHFLNVAILAENRHAELVSASSENQNQTLNQVQGDEETPLFISYRDENEELKTSEIIEILESGKDVALVSDAGTPLISDPGFKLIRVCIKRNITITAVPGPTSIITALTLSGLPTQPFWYFGYLPEKEGKRKKMLERIKKMFSSHSESDSDREKPALSADRNLARRYARSLGREYASSG